MTSGSGALVVSHVESLSAIVFALKTAGSDLAILKDEAVSVSCSEPLTVEALWGVLSLKGGLIHSRLCTVKATCADLLQME